MIDLVRIEIPPAVGADGSATATGYSHHVSGKVLAAAVDHPASGGAATTDYVLTEAEDPAQDQIMAIADSLTDVKYYVRRPIQSNGGADVTYDGTRKVHEPYVVCGRLKATISQANTGQTAIVYVWLER